MGDKRLLIWYWKVPFVLGATGDLGIDRRKSRDTGPDSIEDLGDCKQKTNKLKRNRNKGGEEKHMRCQNILKKT